MNTVSQYELTDKAKKLLSVLLAKKVFQNMQKIEVLSEPEKEGCIQIKADAVQAEYLMLHPKEVGYIIIGRMLDLLDTFFREHIFVYRQSTILFWLVSV